MVQSNFCNERRSLELEGGVQARRKQIESGNAIFFTCT